MFFLPPHHQTLAIKKIVYLEMHTPSEGAWGTVHLMDLFFFTLGLGEVKSHDSLYFFQRKRCFSHSYSLLHIAEISFGPTRRCII